ncbi:tetraacyldisaccharide 4'-kinase [Capnocytophaga cynodegmi]|uniref:tetraacyldisaccharide 4'-kinase n=1 Tax=Capnocytophaga cynodegmi TaxID=28189 RepID=UPI001AD3C913|nr:tetraacyldisaccharide 4'-kinase [Capnocytophaga cynodegmi]GIM52337.1 tetraacyldisaccharide 4'-kinase [Capnocytophaga cynodegmi]
MIKFLRYLLFPISILYGAVVRLRHLLYDYGIFSSTTFNVPIICVGNLSVGGTGKTPMVEYLIKNLQSYKRVGVISRGYKRKAKGFILANEKSTVLDLGDEPFQFWRKYPEIILAVDSDRVRGVEKLLKLQNPPDVILLDDAFQHRRIKARKNVVLTSYNNLYSDDYLLPTGNLRDVVSRAKKADVVVVTKCPTNISEKKRKEITEKLKRNETQKVVFTTISYSKKIYSQEETINFHDFLKTPFVLVTGIANPLPLIHFLDDNQANYKHLQFTDHHSFTNTEIEKLKKESRILTTEKDFVRLQNQLTNIYYLPIETEFVSKSEESVFWEILNA